MEEIKLQNKILFLDDNEEIHLAYVDDNTLTGLLDETFSKSKYPYLRTDEFTDPRESLKEILKEIPTIGLK